MFTRAHVTKVSIGMFWHIFIQHSIDDLEIMLMHWNYHRLTLKSHDSDVKASQITSNLIVYSGYH